MRAVDYPIVSAGPTLRTLEFETVKEEGKKSALSRAMPFQPNSTG